MMRAYASRTGMVSAVEAMTAHSWRMLIEPSQLGAGYGQKPCPLPYMLDNGAWGCFKRGIEWDSKAFERALEMYGSGADMVVLPDIVEGGAASLALSLSWLDRVRAYGVPTLIAVQDGMTTQALEPTLKETGCGLFVGGSTEWKLRTLGDWGRLARSVGCWAHAARVNTAKRIRACQIAGMNSFDGTSVTKWPSTIRLLDNARRQGWLL